MTEETRENFFYRLVSSVILLTLIIGPDSAYAIQALAEPAANKDTLASYSAAQLVDEFGEKLELLSVTPLRQRPALPENLLNRGKEFADSWVTVYAQLLAQDMVTKAREKNIDLAAVQNAIIERVKDWRDGKGNMIPKYRRTLLIDADGLIRTAEGFDIPVKLLKACTKEKVGEAAQVVGVPKEIKPQAERVGLTPAGVKFLTSYGVKVIIEKGAGRQHFSDKEYMEAGAEIVSTAKEVWDGAAIIKKVKEPLGKELEYLRPGLIVFTYLHLASPELADLTKALINKTVTGIAYETIIVEESGKSVTPALKPMSIIAGNLGGFYSIPYLLNSNIESEDTGRKVVLTSEGQELISRIKSEYPDIAGLEGMLRDKKAVVLGGGVSGEAMARRLLEAGARVTITDLNDERLEELGKIFSEYRGNLTLINPGRDIDNPPAALMEKYTPADILGGCILIPGHIAPKMGKELLGKISTNKPKVIIDIALDQGGNFYGSYSRHYNDPVFVDEFGNKRFCVPNMPDAVGKAASIELEKTTIAYTLALAMGLKEAATIFANELKGGVNTLDGNIVCPAVYDAPQYKNLPAGELAIEDGEMTVRPIAPRESPSGTKKGADATLNIARGKVPPAVTQEPVRVIKDVAEAGQQIAAEIATSKSPIDISEMAVIVKKNLVAGITDDKEVVISQTMQSHYQVMKQGLRRLFAGEGSVREAATQEELIGQMNELLGKGLKVIVLDDGALAKDLAAAVIKGRPGEDYCIVSSEPVEDLEKTDAVFVNLNAMAFMGAGILNKNATLFRFAYKSFSGREPGDNLVSQLTQGAQWIVRVLPRVIRFDSEDLENAEKVRKIFAAAA
jgi:alanine dehydrogenase